METSIWLLTDVFEINPKSYKRFHFFLLYPFYATQTAQTEWLISLIAKDLSGAGLSHEAEQPVLISAYLSRMKDLCLQSVHKWHRGASGKHSPSDKKERSCSLTQKTSKQPLLKDLSSFVSFQPDAQEGNTLHNQGGKEGRREIRSPGD